MTFRTIRERNDRGVLVAAGYAWVEEKDSPGIPLFLLMWTGVVAALLGVWVALVGNAVIGASIVVGGIALAWWGRRAMKAYGQSKRALVFRADDTVMAPYGLTGNQAPGAVPIKVSEISNLAFDLQYDTPYIALTIKDGGKIDVIDGRGLTDDEGRLIHTQLTMARDEIRQTMAT